MKIERPVVLCILDGWGYRETSEHNAIAQANTPHWDALWSAHPHSLLQASEGHVGLPDAQMGNSEVGHMTIGAGRVILQDLPRIDSAIKDGSLARNAQLLALIDSLKTSGGVCHLMGLLSDGGVHAHQSHILALAQTVAAHGVPVHLHAILDGRDTPPKSAQGYVQTMLEYIGSETNIQLASLCGRYFAMDRDHRWERVEKAYRLYVDAEGERASDPLAHLAAAYDTASDEFIEPCAIGNYGGMRDGDGLLMANFRADRAREILTAFVDPTFDGFERARVPRFSSVLGMVEYSDELNDFMPSLFPPQSIVNGLGETVSNAGITQLRIAETEKYAHVTFFMNGGCEKPFAGEERILVPSPDVATYDLQPEMSASEVTDKLVAAIESGDYGLIIANYANPDMVGHSGNLNAAIQAVEAIDSCLGRLSDAIKRAGSALLITADHGNVEQMIDPQSQQSHTAHTTNPVPLLLVGKAYDKDKTTLNNGSLADLAPTVLALLNQPKPREMTGISLLTGGT